MSEPPRFSRLGARGSGATIRCLILACAAAGMAGAVLAAGAAGAGKTFSEEDVVAAVKAAVAERSRDGAFIVHDPKSGADLRLVFEEVRIVRGLKDYGWFPDVIFHDAETPAKKYAVDFWLKPEGEALKLMDARVHKEPRPDGASWMMITRAPLLWWWLPTLKRASAVTGVQAWQVMGRVHEHILAQERDGAFRVPDESGEEVALKLVAINQPVGKAKADGGYLACAEFRKTDGTTGTYAVDFRLDPEARSVEAARLHEKNPRAEGGDAASRCRFEGSAFDVVE